MIRTDRLVLRPLDVDLDAASLHAAYTDEETIRWWHLPAPASIDETRDRVEQLRREPGQFAICPTGHEDEGAVGHIGWLSAAPGKRGAFGYLLRRDSWGNGIGVEAGLAALRYGVESLEAAGAELWIYDGNHRSAALAERLGCALRGRFVAFNTARGRPFETLVYGVTARDIVGDDGPPDPARVLDLIPSLDVADVGASVRFWTTYLGFDIEFSVGDPPALVSVARADWTPLRASVRFRAGGAEGRSPVAGVLDVMVADVDLMHAEVTAAGAPIAVDLATQPWGLREFTVVDPNGVRVRFYSPAL